MKLEDLKGWFTGRVPGEWFDGAPDVSADRDEIVIVGTLKDVPVDEGSSQDAARAGRVRQFREDTREARIRIAREAEHAFGRKVSWGVTIGEQTEMFTTAAVPHMTRLRMSERKVLDTLVESGIARSRSDALAWCVRLVGSKQKEWLDELRDALTSVEKVRASGPAV